MRPYVVAALAVCVCVRAHGWYIDVCVCTMVVCASPMGFSVARSYFTDRRFFDSLR